MKLLVTKSMIAAATLMAVVSVTQQVNAQVLKPPAKNNQSTIADLIQQLNAETSSERQAAREKLIDAGSTAVPALEQAAQADDPQQAYSSVRLLGELIRQGDEKTQSAAKKALKEIANSKQPSARQAKKTLEEAEQPKAEQPQGFGGFPGQAQAQAFSMSTSNINGEKTTTVKEGNRTIIIEDGQDGIKITVKDGKGKDTKYQADNEAALKKASKEAAELYSKYGKGNANIRVFGRGAFGGGGLNGLNAPRIVIPNMPQLQGMPQFPFGRRQRRKGEKDPLKEMARLLKEAKELAAESAAAKKKDPKLMKNLLDKLDHMETYLELHKRDIDGGLGF